MRYATLNTLYFGTAAQMNAAKASVASAASGWSGLDTTFANGAGFIDDIRNDHYGGQFLWVVAIGTSVVSVNNVFDFLTAQAVAMGAVTPNPPLQQSEVVVRVVDNVGHIIDGRDGVLGANGTWQINTILPEA